VVLFINSEGTEVTVAADEPGGDLVRTFLLGSVFAILCHKRGLLPLHASCIDIHGRAIALAGASGAGKSVLAAAFMKAGCPVISDDITAIDVAAAGGAMVRASFPQLKLWRDALDGLGFDRDCCRRSRSGIEKFNLACREPSAGPPRRLAGIYHLRRANKGDTCSINRLSAVRALRDTADAVYHGETFAAFLAQSTVFQSVARLFAAAPAYSLAYPPGFEALPDTVAVLLAGQVEQL
jgi:hypothetical protein